MIGWRQVLCGFSGYGVLDYHFALRYRSPVRAITRSFSYTRRLDSMAEQQYEYRVEPAFLSPTELRNEQYKLEDLFNDIAEEGWIYDDVAVVDPSSLLFFFRRPIDA